MFLIFLHIKLWLLKNYIIAKTANRVLSSERFLEESNDNAVVVTILWQMKHFYTYQSSLLCTWKFTDTPPSLSRRQETCVGSHLTWSVAGKSMKSSVTVTSESCLERLDASINQELRRGGMGVVSTVAIRRNNCAYSKGVFTWRHFS